MTLMELATALFNCSQVIVCLDRSIEGAGLGKLIRNFGWVGFGLTTLDGWGGGVVQGDLISDRWIFLSMDA